MTTTRTNVARAERMALCDSLSEVGPDAPTLCDPWRSRHLAAHLLMRERRPDLAAGMFVPALRGRHDAGLQAMAVRPWEQTVHQLRSGPPPWHPARVGWVDDFSNTLEMFVHHEDVLRGGPTPGPGRELGAEQQQALWHLLGSRFMRVLVRRSPTGVDVVAPGYGRRTLKAGPPVVVVSGAPLELLLFVTGRQRVARVDQDGPADAVQQLSSAPLGL